ncbi:hypothetical protein Pcinc_007345 [Petrolisthes cinctipes]|uniref:Uncharacterized protein n=1 Tax=Petrolisthes cinctipes TaxID=88211 RepID=A0AAE1GB38_PETCI|nr:hypothetical protein Pcinc_007345 [Petrolisthes cinctipes]
MRTKRQFYQNNDTATQATHIHCQCLSLTPVKASLHRLTQNSPASMSGNSEDAVPHAPDNNTTPSEVQHAAPVEEPHMVTQHGQSTAEPSIERPTREFLEKNYLKIDLQERCRELGITNIWTNKSHLIEMILEKSGLAPNDMLSRPAASDATLTPYPRDDTPTQEDNAEPERIDLLHIAREIEMIKSKLATKDMEIELLNTEVKAAYHTIEQLQHRVTELEKHHCDSGDHHTSGRDKWYTTHAGGRQSTGQGGTGGPAPRPPAPRAGTPARPILAHLQAASSAHNYKRSTSHHLPLTTSSKPASYRSSTTPEAASHCSLRRTMRREQAGDGNGVGGERGPYTYVAALSRGME